MNKNIFILVFLITYIPFCLIWCSEDVYLDMSLEELINTDIVTTASKTPEDLFETPLDVTIIKKEEILNSGASSIPEALRLAPGLIVREQTPGNYDVQIRGFDTATTSFMMPTPTCTIILVMIDNRVVYDYFSGGTFWEMLGVDLTDIERIEIVRGPASALYGPNAMAGVINIITSHSKEPGLHFYSNVKGNSAQSGATNINLEYNSNDKFMIALTANMQRQSRIDSKYYSQKFEQYTDIEDVSSLMYCPEGHDFFDFFNIKYENPELSLEKGAINVFSRYNFNDADYVSLDWGFHHAKSQKTFYNNFCTPLSEYESEGHYINLYGSYKNFLFQQTINHGRHDNNYYWNRYDYFNYDSTIEYPFELLGIFIRPGLTQRVAKYAAGLMTDTMFDENRNIPDKTKSIISQSASCLIDVPLNNKWRLIFGTRDDNYNLNDHVANSYEAGFTYRASKDNLYRVILSKAFRTPFMIDSFVGKASTMYFDPHSVTGDTLAAVVFQGNPDLPFLTNVTVDFGMRAKINPSATLDCDIFMTTLTHFSNFVQSTPSIIEPVYDDQDNYLYTVETIPLTMSEQENLRVYQSGINFTFSYKYSSNAKLKIYGMAQQTKEKNSIANLEYTGFLPESTPDLMLGYTLDIKPWSKMNLFWQHLYYTKQDFDFFGLLSYLRTRIEPYHQLNLNCNYNLNQHHTISLALKNLQGKHREYPFTDNIYFNALFGYTYKF